MAAKKDETKRVTKKAATKPLPKAAPAAASVPAPVAKRAAGPSARSCPLVLDGEIDAADFSPSDCLTCSEFDCRFCEAEEGSGVLRSRLFAADDDEGDDGFGGDFDAGGDEGGGVEDESSGDEEDQF